MKSYLLIVALGMLVCFLPVNDMQAQPSQQKVEVQGALKLGETQTRTLAPGAIHVWNLALQADQYVVVEVLQKGIDVVVRIVDPDNAQRGKFDSPTGASGMEKAYWITNSSGTWKVEVALLEAGPSGDYEIKFAVFRKATETDRKVNEADSLKNEALKYFSQRDYAKAEPLFIRVLELTEETLGSDHLDVAKSLRNIGALYANWRKFEEAEKYARKAFAVTEKALGPDHPEMVDAFYGLAALYYNWGRYVDAVPNFRKALAVAEKALGPDHLEVAVCLNNLAMGLGRLDKQSEAELVLKRALEIRQKALGPNHPDVAHSLNDLAGTYANQGRYTESASLFERTLAINETALGTNHPEVAKNLANLGVVYESLTKYTEAEPLFQRALTIREKARGPDDPEVENSLVNLGGLRRKQGKLSEAETFYRRALAIIEKTQGLNHPNVALYLNNLGSLYRDQGRHTEAEPLLKRALTITEKAYGPDNLRVATLLNNLAALYHAQGKHSDAESLLRRSLAIGERAQRPDDSRMVSALVRLAALYRDLKKYNEAESLLRRSLTISEKQKGPEHIDVANTLNALAHVMYLAGTDKPDSVLPLIERAIGIYDAFSINPDKSLNAYGLRAQLRREKGDFQGALSDLVETLHLAEKLRFQIGGGEETHAGFFEKYTDHFARMVNWQIELSDIEKALEYAERSRARVLLDQHTAAQIGLFNSIPEEDKRISLENRQTNAKAFMAEYQRRINLLPSRKDLSNDEKNKQIAALKDSLKLAEKDYEQVWEEIKLASPLWQNVATSGGQPVSLTTIQNELIPPNGLMLLYQIGKEGSHLFVIPPGEQKPEAISLQVTDKDTSMLQVKAGPLKSTDLQKILADSSAGLLRYLKTNPDVAKSEQEKLATAKPYGRRLQALWNVLMPSSVWPKVKASAEVIMVPDGLLHQLPFEALVVQSGKETRYWLDEGPVIRYAPSATILYSLEKRQIEKSPAQPAILSLSDPIFDLEMVGKEMQKQIASRAATPQDSTTTQSLGLVETLMAETRSNELALAGPLPKLPGTGFETDYIRQHFGAKNVKALQQLQADEPHLRANIQGKRYVHLATHGLVELQHSSLSNALALTPPPKDTVNSENDGFLKLYEIYELKLNNCELAVLSACETHFGRLFEGEGVFALSRGFLAAGAARVVASHWQVQDISTAELVGAFFRSVANAEKNGKPVDYALALRDAKLRLRRDKNRRQWAAPYFWAPFIITGKR